MKMQKALRNYMLCSVLVMVLILLTTMYMFISTERSVRYSISPAFDLPRSSMKRVSIISNVTFNVNEILDKMNCKIIDNDFTAEFNENGTGTRSAPTNNTFPNQGKSQDVLYVIVVPHSHNDPGYKRNFEEYYSESTGIILSLIVKKMLQYTDMTFVWPEVCFLERWWQDQSSETREKFRQLVLSGRLELTPGSWVVPDEATPHYFDLLNQMIEGHYWVKTHLGVFPKASADMDQFGYSPSVRYLMKKAGLKYSLIKRIHRGIKSFLTERKIMNFVWRQIWDDEGENDLFIQVEPYEWLSFPDTCGPVRKVCNSLDFVNEQDLPLPGSPNFTKPIQLLEAMYDSVHHFAEKVVEQLQIKSRGFNHNILLLPHGADFRYDTEREWDKQYKNMRLLMSYINENKHFNVRMDFGTFTDYFENVIKQSEKHNLQHPVVYGDFFPFTWDLNYWSGYFTSRPFSKQLGRELSELVRAVEMFSFVLFSDKMYAGAEPERQKDIYRKLISARRTVAFFQHHDAITGTSFEIVMQDYESKLSSAFGNAMDVLLFVIKHLLQENSVVFSDEVLHSTLEHTVPHMLTNLNNVEIYTIGTKLIFINPLLQYRKEIITLKFSDGCVLIKDSNGDAVNVDVIEAVDKRIVLSFEVSFPPLGFIVYTVNGTNKTNKTNNVVQRNTVEGNSTLPLTCENSFVIVTFSSRTGSPSNICYKNEKRCYNVSIDVLHFYNEDGGVYSMRTLGRSRNMHSENNTIEQISGKTFCKVKIKFGKNKKFEIAYAVMLTKGVSGLGITINIIGDISELSEKFVGDIGVRINTDIDNKDIFYVDSNGLQLLRRKFRKTVQYDGNVYPMTSMAIIEDSLNRLTVHCKRPHGVTSSSSGSLDVFIDRIAVNAEFGLREAVSNSKMTETLLVLEFENLQAYKKPALTEAVLPSQRSIYLNDALQHPIYSFYTKSDLKTKFPYRTFLKVHLSCEFVIANMKNLFSDNLNSDGVSLTLFRRATLLGLSVNEFCSISSTGNIYPANLIGEQSQKVLIASEMYLTLLDKKRTLLPHESLHMEPMDIMTVHLHE